MLTNCEHCGEELDDVDICKCPDCFRDGMCEDCLFTHECDFQALSEAPDDR